MGIGGQPHFSERRKIQNRLAQRKFREKTRAEKQSGSSGTPENFINDDQSQNNHLDPLLSAMEFQQQEGNTGLSLGNYLGASLVFPCNASSMPSHDGTFAIAETIKDTSCPSVRIEAAADPSFQLADLDARYKISHPTQAECDTMFNQNPVFFGDGKHDQQSLYQVRTNINEELLKSCECGHSDRLNKALQYQRTQLCDQAEQLIEKALSVYDIGISLGVLVSNSRLRDLLIKTLDGFRAQRQPEAHNRDERALEDNECIS
ncbi:hypothetical protein BGW36DRAFT_459121 [Talaromyces proteolyticus]|uniref:BZIP domain-containing protein n=1 Tax=Talaromyces proteolyticus TaxID=1131652 RepID=A0AAD4L396_9EURO|nr:uncharacterized protein BGW36DRAFT_459121 [Talaromyces proteolyticus]KAH8702419.1 hypothetical protein BGW36DRAFT_459121 [Talaromyces proteolyticus]